MAQPRLSEIDPTARATLTELSAHCQSAFDRMDQPRVRDLCHRTFDCGDGGCDAQTLIVIVARDRVDDLFARADRLRFSALERCDPDDPFEAQFVDIFANAYAPPYLDGWRDRFRGRDYVALCPEVVPGFEIETVLALRQHLGMDVAAVRTGGEAGSPSALMWISQAQFFALRDAGLSAIRPLLRAAIEARLGTPCQTDARMTCDIVPQGGKLRMRLLVADGAMTDRPGMWEQTYWEVYPHWLGGTDQYALSFDMPITSIRRWPADGGKPRDGFQSLDFDQGFEDFRLSVMSRMADALEAEVEAPW